MTLEQEAYKQRGGFGQRPVGWGDRPPTTFDRLARGVALLLLLLFIGASLYVLATFWPAGFVLATAALWILVISLLSRLHELGRRVRTLEEKANTPSAEAPQPGGPGGPP